MTPSLLALLLTFSMARALPEPPPAAQAPPQTAGLDENLGKTVPLALTLLDEQSRPVPLSDLINRPTLLTLNYFRCAGLCTPQLNGLATALNQMRLEPGKDFQVLTVSFDPRDTPQIAAGKRVNYLAALTRPCPPEAWRFLTGGVGATRALAEAVGFGFQSQGQEFIHPAALIVLSPQGRITRYLYGVSYLPAELDMAVSDAAKGLTRPTVPKWLSFCYSADPSGRKQVFSVTRAAAVVTLAGAAVFLSMLLLRRRRAGRS